MTATYSSYTVAPASGIYIGTDFYETGTVLYLTDASAKYLLLNGQIVRSPDYVPPTTDPVQPAPITETNTLVEVVIDGDRRYVTMANLINLFPRLQPTPGPVGPAGPQGEQGEIGPSGNISINGRFGPTFTLAKGDVGLSQVENYSSANLPVSNPTQAALDLKVDVAKVGVPGGTASLDATSGKIPFNQIPLADMPVPDMVAAAIAKAISDLIGGADAAYDTLKEIETLLKGDDVSIAALFTAVNKRLIAANNLSDLTSPGTARANLLLGSIATQDATNISVTGGTIDGTTIGATTPTTGKFTTISASGTITGNVQGNATTATTLANTRNIAVGGFITGTIGFNGSQDVTITTTLNTVIPVVSGGTGATTADAARVNLVAAKSGANTDITSLNAPALGAATATTAGVNTNTTQVATTAFVLGQSGTASPTMAGTAAVGTATRFSREDHVHPSDTSRVSKAGDTMTGELYAPLMSIGGASGRFLFNARDNTTAFQVLANGNAFHVYSNNGYDALTVSATGVVSTYQLGDLKTYIDTKLPLAGGALTGNLQIAKTFPAYVLTYPSVIDWGMFIRADGYLCWSAGGYNPNASSSITARMGSDGSFWTVQIGDLKTYIDTKLNDTGDTVTGELNFKFSNPAFALTNVGGTYDQFGWHIMNYTGDGNLYFQDYRNGVYNDNSFYFTRAGAIYSKQMGDVKTYVDTTSIGNAVAMAIALG